MSKFIFPLFLFVCTSCFGQPLSCVSNGGINIPVRAEGLSELVGDFQVICTGGTPTAAGVAAPTVNIQVFLNTTLTSRCLESTSSVGCLGQYSEALLILDDPLPANQYGCPTVTCANVGSGTGAGGYGPGTVGTIGNNKNIFQAVQTASNSVTFLGIPIDPPGVGSQRIIRIVNIRANANGLGVASGNNAPTSVTETIQATPLNSLPISGLSTQAVASVQLSMATSVTASPTFAQPISQNAALAMDPSAAGVSQFSVRFRELFSTAFKKRNIATTVADPSAVSEQNDLIVGVYNTESGFYKPSLTLPAVLAPPGLPDTGTALMVRFNSIPNGVSLYSAITGTVTGGGPGAVRRVNGDINGAAPYFPTPGNPSGLALIPMSSGTATAVFEVVEADANSFAIVDIPIYVAYTGNFPVSPALGTATVNLSYAPVSTTTSAVYSMVPRFADTSSAINAFKIEPLHCATIGVALPVLATGGIGETSVNTDAGCQWTAFTNDSWITVLPSGPVEGAIHYSIAPNNSVVPRTGLIYMHFVGQTQMPDQALLINQAGIPCVSAVSPMSAVFSYWGESRILVLTATSPQCPWDVTVNGSWINLTSASSGQGSAFVTFTVNQNFGSPRTGSVTIAGKTVTMTQQGPQVPTVVSSAPASGSGITQTFVFGFDDRDGWQDLGVVNILINRALDGRNACYLAYDRPSNVLYLVGDIGGGLTGTPLGSGSVSNSQCTINSAASSFVGNGNTLTLSLSITFNQANFAGEKIVYLAARDSGLHNSGWVTSGAWSVPRAVPVFPSIVSLTPSQGAGYAQQFAITYRDVSSSANLRSMQILINSALDGNQACYLGYDHVGNVLYLVNDNNSGLLLPGIVPGSNSGTVENSQCTLSGAGTAKVESGSDLTLYVALSFKPSFWAPKVIFTGVQTLSNANSDWHVLGYWNIP